MLPRQQYRPVGYPPPGTQWPQFGDRKLDKAFASLSAEAHAHLVRKRAAMAALHRERLQAKGFQHYHITEPDHMPVETYAESGRTLVYTSDAPDE